MIILYIKAYLHIRVRQPELLHEINIVFDVGTYNVRWSNCKIYKITILIIMQWLFYLTDPKY